MLDAADNAEGEKLWILFKLFQSTFGYQKSSFEQETKEKWCWEHQTFMNISEVDYEPLGSSDRQLITIFLDLSSFCVRQSVVTPMLSH